MKDKIFSVLQRIGRSFMLPIAILPVAGLLLGIGSSFTNATTIETYGLTKILGDGTILHYLLMIMNKVGSAVFVQPAFDFCSRRCHWDGKKRERGFRSFCSNCLFCYEYSNQRHAYQQRTDS